jgi:hypothetical protein
MAKKTRLPNRVQKQLDERLAQRKKEKGRRKKAEETIAAAKKKKRIRADNARRSIVAENEQDDFK